MSQHVTQGPPPRGHGRRRVWALGVGLVALAAAGAGAQGLPQNAPDKHLGVATCAGGPCHGAGSPGTGNVRQNEYTTWQREDRHAKAYQVLLNDESKRIARNLGLREPAHESDLCLDCHADNVPAEQRGEKFNIEDGVGCEACHGGSERWIQAHTAAGAKHERNQELGLYPTDEPVARAELCLSCHFGTDDKFVTHRIMGAGHPRMSFELDTFTQFQPAHHDIDDDYEERGKEAPPAATVWAVGQAVQVREILEALVSPTRGHEGVWPSFILFDCHSCHHPMSKRTWTPRASTGLAAHPGAPRMNDSSFLMLNHVLAAHDPPTARRFESQSLALFRAVNGTGGGSVPAAVASVRSIVDGVIPDLAETDFTADEARTIAQSLIKDGLANEYRDYAGAEQAVMGVQALAVTMDQLGAIDGENREQINADLDALLELTKNDESYVPSRLPSRLRTLQARLR